MQGFHVGGTVSGGDSRHGPRAPCVERRHRADDRRRGCEAAAPIVRQPMSLRFPWRCFPSCCHKPALRIDLIGGSLHERENVPRNLLSPLLLKKMTGIRNDDERLVPG